MIGIKDMRLELERRKGQRDQVLKDLERQEADNKTHYLQSLYCEEAQTVIIEVAKITQSELEYHIGDLVTLALASVFDDPYEMGIEFVQRRNRTECDLFFIKDGKRVDPMTASGGGAVDVASFALRLSLWSLANPRTRNTIVFDEPFRFLSKGLQPKASSMLKDISEKLNLQVIMVTHSEDLVDGADKIMNVYQRRGISYIN